MEFQRGSNENKRKRGRVEPLFKKRITKCLDFPFIKLSFADWHFSQSAEKQICLICKYVKLLLFQKARNATLASFLTLTNVQINKFRKLRLNDFRVFLLWANTGLFLSAANGSNYLSWHCSSCSGHFVILLLGCTSGLKLAAGLATLLDLFISLCISKH